MTTGSKVPRRYRLYFRLMDVTLVLSIIGFSEFLLDNVFGIILIPKDSPAYRPVSIIMVSANFFLPMFLIAARFMRDEFAEILWQRTATTLMYLLVLAPGIILVWSFVMRMAGGNDYISLFGYLYRQNALDAIVAGWIAVMLLFVAIFQLYRWRATRG